MKPSSASLFGTGTETDTDDLPDADDAEAVKRERVGVQRERLTAAARDAGVQSFALPHSL